MSENGITEYLRQNPRKIGVLFTLALLLASAGNSAATWGVGFAGP